MKIFFVIILLTLSLWSQEYKVIVDVGDTTNFSSKLNIKKGLSDVLNKSNNFEIVDNIPDSDIYIDIRMKGDSELAAMSVVWAQYNPTTNSLTYLGSTVVIFNDKYSTKKYYQIVSSTESLILEYITRNSK